MSIEIRYRKAAVQEGDTGEVIVPASDLPIIARERSIPALLDMGIVPLNKPKGPTSHQVSEFVKKILKISKAGHAGTLDPAVTGVLPVALGRGTRIVEWLLPEGKEYICIMHLHKVCDEKIIRNVCSQFVGRIKQMVPRKAAVKRQVRERNVYSLEVLEIKEKDVLFKADVESGTYIRTLCHDIGRKLGGGHMAELVRSRAGPFRIEEIVTLQDVEDAMWYYENGNELPLRKCVLPIESACLNMQKVWVFDTTIPSLCHGAPLHVPGILGVTIGIIAGSKVCVLSPSGEIVGLGTSACSSEQLATQPKGLGVTLQTVLMKC